MTEQIEKQKLPWPSRLANSATKFTFLGFIICGLSLPFLLVTKIMTACVLLSGASVIFLGFLCAVIALVSLPFYKFKAPGIGNILLTMILGYPVLAFGLAIMGPAFARAHHQAENICQNNIKALTRCFQIYTSEYKNRPTPEQWCDLLKAYNTDNTNNLFMCPVDTIGPCSYAMNENIPEGATKLPEDLVVLFESAPGWNQLGGADDVVTDRHDEPGANIAFADGRVEFVETSDISNLRWTVDNQSMERK